MKRRVKRGINETGTIPRKIIQPVIPEKIPYDIESKVAATE
jgi:hypothetical protein